MKVCSFLVPVLLFTCLLVLACESAKKTGHLKKCSIARTMKICENLYTKIITFKASFPTDSITDIKLLTNKVRKNFTKTCNMRDQLLAFYVNIVFGTELVREKAEKLHIKEDFEDMQVHLRHCSKSPCESHPKRIKSMIELKRKYSQLQKEKGLYKAISELDILFKWIFEYLHSLQSTALVERHLKHKI